MNDSINYLANNSVFNTTNSTFPPNTDWGPKRDPLAIVVPISVIYIFIFITGILGNISTCFVIATNKCMHTATNYYLFSLAISDLLLLISGLPPEIYSIWSRYPYVFGEEFCVLQGFAAEASANATVLTITAFTIERYVAICYPFLSHTLSKLNRAIKYIIYIWIIAISLAIPQALAFGVVCEVINGRIVNDHCVCIPKRSVIPHAFEISTLLFFVAPMSLITILYVLIGMQLHKSLRPIKGDDVKIRHRLYKPVVNFGVNHVMHEYEMEMRKCNRVEEDGRKIYAKNARAAKHVVKMLVAVVIAFFICWAPFHAQRLFAIYGAPNSRQVITAFQILTYISGVFYYLSTTINPLLYNIMSHKFREAFKATYKQCCKKSQRLPGGRFYSSFSARSSQVNSHSTDSQIQSTIRYLEEEIAHIRDQKRPLVVSFKKKKYPSPYYNPELREALQTLRNSKLDKINSYQGSCEVRFKANCHIDLKKVKAYAQTRFDVSDDVQAALDLLRTADASAGYEPSSPSANGDCSNAKTDEATESQKIEYLELKRHCSFMNVNSLQPTHICPLNKNVEFL
ncbi:unnamed protein product [Psylliodes chrysocephalus]|uniref:Diapause hormone receptor n=1 Tax=Psylliodes chrysocephalus TaxID=3402493 RepID=A0A9P0GEM9_9CUCU|nr:unnamed protein product [Psylliodes chrysocephala]